MAYVNFKELKEERPARNFDKVDITEDFDIGAQDGDSLYGTFSFFHGIKSFFKKVMSAASALVSGKILMSDENGNVTGIAPSDLKTGMDLMNSEDVNNALANKRIFESNDFGEQIEIHRYDPSGSADIKYSNGGGLLGYMGIGADERPEFVDKTGNIVEKLATKSDLNSFVKKKTITAQTSLGGNFNFNIPSSNIVVSAYVTSNASTVCLPYNGYNMWGGHFIRDTDSSIVGEEELTVDVYYI